MIRKKKNNRTSNINKITGSESFKKAFEDINFLNCDDLRPIRLQLELLKPEMIQNEHNIISTIVVFGSARTPDYETAQTELQEAKRKIGKSRSMKNLASLKRARKRMEHAHYYEVACEFGRIVSSTCQINNKCEYVIVTGGGPGIMEAVNRGAYEVGAKSIGMNIELPYEQSPNPYITPGLCFNFRYFAIRKMHFLMRAKALVACPGGFGTMDELFEALTLIQTNKMPRVPIVLIGREFWEKTINFPVLVEEGVISHEDLNLITYAETALDAWYTIADFYEDSEC